MKIRLVTLSFSKKNAKNAENAYVFDSFRCILAEELIKRLTMR